MMTTLLYYSDNRESPEFEGAVVKNIKEKCKDFAIVSVTQKPMDMGKNICVGEHYPCYFNEFRQIQTGLAEIKTPYVLTGEADFLYPLEYFTAVPGYAPCYRYKHVWVYYTGDTVFRYKGASDGAQLIRRDYWLEMIEKGFKGKKDWVSEGDDLSFARMQPPMKGIAYWYGQAAVTVKTKNNISKKTQLSPRYAPTTELVYWGTVDKVREDFHV